MSIELGKSFIDFLVYSLFVDISFGFKDPLPLTQHTYFKNSLTKIINILIIKKMNIEINNF